MASEEDPIFRAFRGSGGGINFVDLKNGNISLYDIVRLNEAMDIEIENGRIIQDK